MIILMFALPSPPKEVKAAYMRITVKIYIPNPLPCFTCQTFSQGKSDVTVELFVLNVLKRVISRPIVKTLCTMQIDLATKQLSLKYAESGLSSGK